MDSFWLPKDGKPVWLVFDLENGHCTTRRYVWWFDTKKQALEWAKERKEKYPSAAAISAPRKFVSCE